MVSFAERVWITLSQHLSSPFPLSAYGHGVGLSQEGARAMAAGGSSWQDILLYYFPGTQIGQES